MADYEIDLSSLQSRKSDLDSLKSKASNIYNEFASSTLANLGGEISSLSNKLKTPMERFNKGYNNSSEWLGNYISEFQSLESNLASFSGNTIDKPVLFSKKFTDIFRKVTIPMLQTKKEEQTSDVKVTNSGASANLNGNIIDTSSALSKGNTYNLTKEELAFLAYVAKREQGSVAGAKIELSLMANLYEKNKHKYKSVYDYVRRSGWFGSKSRQNYKYPGDEYYNAAKDVLSNGNRYIAKNVVEHDCFSDIKSISTGSVRNRQNYIPGKTIIRNVYGAKYVFVGFAPNNGDPFGYLI